MSKPAITVENLSKAYRIGLKEEIPDTLVGALTGLLKAPIRNFRRLRRLNTYGGANADGNGRHDSNSPDNDEEDLIWALKDVSFEVQEGEALGIIGRNGAGKSTLLKILSRITEPTAGRATIRGRVSSLLEVGTGFHPELSGRENVYMNGTILGMTKREIDSKFDEIVDFSGVEKFLDTPIKRYSSGMKVRLAFSVAAHLEPEILIIDEVLAVGDTEFQKRCLGKMHDVANGGRTVLFVSHNMGAVHDLCETGVWLHAGSAHGPTGIQVTIDDYLSSIGNTASATYTPMYDPGDPIALLHADLRDSQNRNTHRIRFGERFAINTSWQHNRTLQGVSYSIRVRDSRYRLVFATNTIGQERLQLNSVGAHVLSCIIDPNLLVPGGYTVSIGAFARPYGEIRDHPDCIRFDVDAAPVDGGDRFLAKGDPAIAAPAVWTRPVSSCSEP